MIIPKHLFEAYKGDKSREAPNNLKPVGTGPYKFADFKPGDIVRGDLNPNYHMPNRPHFDTIEMKGGGDAVSAARAVIQTGEFDFAWNLQVEDEILKRMEQGGKGHAGMVLGGNIEHVQCNFTDPWKEVDGERSSLKTKHPFLSDPAVRQALALLVDRGSVQEQIYGRTGIATANFLNAPDRFRSKATKWEFSVDKANQILEAAGWKKGGDGIRAKDGVKLKMVYQTSINASRQKTQAIVKQAAAKAGIEMELKSVTASVYFSSDVANPDTYAHFYTDIQMYTTTMTQPDPETVHGAVHHVGGGLQGQQVAGPEHHALAERGVRQAVPRCRARDGPGQAGGALHQDERAGDRQQVVIPVVQRLRGRRHLHAAFKEEQSAWDSDFWALHNWYREG